MYSRSRGAAQLMWERWAAFSDVCTQHLPLMSRGHMLVLHRDRARCRCTHALPAPTQPCGIIKPRAAQCTLYDDGLHD